MINQKDEAFNRCWSKYYKEHSWNYMDEELSSDLAYYFWKSALEQPTQEPMIIKQDNGMVLKLGYDDLPNGTAFYTHPKEWQGLSDDEFVAIAKSIWGDNLGMSDGYGYTVAWASSYATIEPSSKMLLLYHAIEKALKEKNHEQT